MTTKQVSQKEKKTSGKNKSTAPPRLSVVIKEALNRIGKNIDQIDHPG